MRGFEAFFFAYLFIGIRKELEINLSGTARIYPRLIFETGIFVV
jgi:hypothetical protein